MEPEKSSQCSNTLVTEPHPKHINSVQILGPVS